MNRVLPKRRLALLILLIGLLCAENGGAYVAVQKLGHGRTPDSRPAVAARPSQPPVIQAAATYGSPLRLKIPKINVDAALDYVGITSGGDLDAPKGPANAGWFDQGPRPGEAGNAVIDGHYGWSHNIPAVFDKLHTLQGGDTVDIYDDRGKITTFVVRELRTFGKHDDATAVFRPSDDKAHLNLVTCQGSWNATEKSYSSRLVVFTDRQI